MTFGVAALAKLVDIECCRVFNSIPGPVDGKIRHAPRQYVDGDCMWHVCRGRACRRRRHCRRQ